jgi:hypothetical protein
MEVAFSVDGNGQQNNPGIYLNHSMVCFRGFGQEIQFGPNVEEAGFGASPLPAGASAVPLASSVALPGMPPPAAPAPPPMAVQPNPGFLQVPQPNPTTVVPGVPASSQPIVHGATSFYPPPSTTYPNASPVAPGAVTAYPSNVPPAPPMAPAPPAAPSYRMTEKAAGATREAFLAAGWDDARLIQQGFMLP